MLQGRARACGLLLLSLLSLCAAVPQARAADLPEGGEARMMLIACRRDSDLEHPRVDTFSELGVLLANYDYDADVPGGSSTQCLYQRTDGTFALSANLVYAVTLTSAFGYVSQQTMTDPTAGSATTPQFYANRQPATRVIGLWQNFPVAVVQDIDPLTFAQTTLWTNFQPDTGNGVAGRGLSRDGTIWYYTQADDIFALDLSAGITTTFITMPVGASTVCNTGTTGIYELPDGTFLVLWRMLDNSLRIIQYDAGGSPAGIDIDLTGVVADAAVFAPEPDGSGVWVLGQAGAPDFFATIVRYAIPGGSQTLLETTGSTEYPDYVDLAIVADGAQPVPNPTPRAAQTPCIPESEVSNGGAGHFGCNTGGVGWTSMYPDGPYDDVPQHADPTPGETLTGKRQVDLWMDWRHRNPSSSPSTERYQRAKIELGHLPAYEGGRKPAGLKALGRVSHAIGNELHAFETGDLSLEYADAADRLVRTIADGQSVRNDEILLKGASPEGVAANTPPCIFARALIQQARMTAPMGARLEAVDQISTYFATRQYPHWTFRDLGGAIPNAPADTLDLPITPLYGEKSDEGADPISRGLISGIYCGKFDLTSLGLDAPPDTPGYEFGALVAALQVSVDANTTDADWGDCIGHGDAAFLEAMGTVPNDYTRLAQVIGYGDLDALLSGDCGGGITPAPDDTEWGLIVFGLAEWFRVIPYGSNLSGGDAIAEQTRVLLDPSGSDMLHPDYTWPLPNRYLELTNPDTGRTFWLTAIFVRGPLLEDHINGKITITTNAVGIMGNAGLPIIDAHACEQHWHENFVQNDWSSGPWTDDVDYPQWGDGTPKVNTTSFADCQALSASLMGGSPLSRGLTIGWFPKEIKTLKACVDDWDRDTESKTGFNGFWQVVKYRFDPNMTGFARVDHPEHVFGPIRYTPGEDPENVISGSCDYDPDGSKFRAVLSTPRQNTEGIAYQGEEIPGTNIESTILNRIEQLETVLDWRLLRLRFGATYIDVPRDLGAWDVDLTNGIALTTIEGTGASGFVGRRCVKLRRELDLDTRLVTDTLWDVERLLTP